MIVSGQMTREEAVKKLDNPLYDPKELEDDILYFCKKLRISRADFEDIMKVPCHSYKDFPNWDFRYKALKTTKNIFEKLLGLKLKVSH